MTRDYVYTDLGDRIMVEAYAPGTRGVHVNGKTDWAMLISIEITEAEGENARDGVAMAYISLDTARRVRDVLDKAIGFGEGN